MPEPEPIKWTHDPDWSFRLHAEHNTAVAVVEPRPAWWTRSPYRFEGRVYADSGRGKESFVTEGDDVREIQRRCEAVMRRHPDAEVDHARVLVRAIRGRVKGLLDVAPADCEANRKLAEILNLIDQSGVI